VPWARGYTIYTIHRVQHTPITAYTEYCIHCVLHHPEINYLLVPTSLSSLGKPSCTKFSTFPKLPVIKRHSTPVAPLSWTLAYKYSSKLPRSRFPTASTNLLDHSIQVCLKTSSMPACKFVQWWPPSASRHSIDYHLQVHLETRVIITSICISKLAQSQPPCVSLNSHHYSLQVRTITPAKWISCHAQAQPPRTSLSRDGRCTGRHG